MSKISVYYKEIKLGELTFDDEYFIYSANKENVEHAHKLNYPTFLYNCDNDFKSKSLPYSFDDFIVKNKNIHLYPQAKIFPSDTLFERLYKFAKLDNGTKPDFHLQID